MREYRKEENQELQEEAIRLEMEIGKEYLQHRLSVVITTCYGAKNRFLVKSGVYISHMIFDEATLITTPMSLIAINLLYDKSRTIIPCDKEKNKDNGNNMSESEKSKCDSSDSFGSKSNNSNSNKNDCNNKSKAIIMDSPHLTMIGDPKQLNPIVQSNGARGRHLNISPFEQWYYQRPYDYDYSTSSKIHSAKDYNEKIERYLGSYGSTPKVGRKKNIFNLNNDDNSLMSDGNYDLNALSFEAGTFHRSSDLVRRCKEKEQTRIKEEEPVYFQLLSMQYRMHEIICEFPNVAIYGGRLKNFVMNDNRNGNDNNGDDNYYSPLEFENLKNTISTKAGSSAYNNKEVDRISTIIQGLLMQNYRCQDIAVITPYRAQERRLVSKLHGNIRYNDRDSNSNSNNSNYGKSKEWEKITIATVSRFQGKEKDVIILSMVKSDKDGYSRFIDDSRLCNVALTRAKRKLIVVGSRNFLEQHGIWSAWIQFVEQKGRVKTIHL